MVRKAPECSKSLGPAKRHRATRRSTATQTPILSETRDQMSETATQPTQQQQQETQDQAMAGFEAELQGELNGEKMLGNEPAPAADKTKDKPQGKERDETGKFKAKEEAAVETDTDDETPPAENTEAEEIDPFDDPKPAANTPKPHQPDKAIQKLQQDFGVMRREMQETISSLKEELKAARAAKPEAPAPDKAAKLKALVDQGLLDPDVADTIAELVGTPAEVPDISSLQSEIAELRAERAFDKTYPALAGKYGRACELAWEAAQKRFPSLDPRDPRVINYAQGKLHDIAEEAVARRTAKGKQNRKA